ncbi:MAG: protein translocase subunit SecD [Actinomycetia bacterium]|nr:protein translocase subunit SecD [Actinomycetes bacterium]
MGGWMAWKGVNTPKLGLDLQGGTTVTLVPSPAEGEKGTITDESIDEAVNIISARVNGAGVAEAEVAKQGSGQNAVIVVSVPGVTEDALVEQLGQTARLGFRPVLAAQPAVAPTPVPSPSSTDKPGSKKDNKNSGQQGGGNGGLLPRIGPDVSSANAVTGKNDKGGGNQSQSPTPTTAPSVAPAPAPAPTPTAAAVPPELQQQFNTLDCTDQAQQNVGTDFPDKEPAIACDRNGNEKFLLGPVAVPGSDVDTAQANLQQNTAGWVVSLDFNSDGTKTFGQITAEMALQPPDTPGNRFAIVLDGVVVSAPGVNEAIPGGQAQISGQFTQQESQDLANVLKFGALPLTFEIAERSTISPTLGDDQLQAGLIAGALGLALVVLYLLVYYRALALVAVSSLIIAGAFTYASVVILGETLGFTLTLAGVAGLIVAIGITADSFIVYFERIRDEVREGRSLRSALESGWVRARRTIVAADFISLIAAVVLWVLSVGGVRGFAFTLGLTTVIDLIVVFLFTKPLVTLLARTKFFNSGSKWSGLSPERLGAKPKPENPKRPSRQTVKEA